MKHLDDTIHVFVDESHPEGSASGRVRAAAIATPETPFEERRGRLRDIARMGAKKRIEALRQFLNDPAFLVAVVDINGRERSSRFSGPETTSQTSKA